MVAKNSLFLSGKSLIPIYLKPIQLTPSLSFSSFSNRHEMRMNEMINVCCSYTNEAAEQAHFTTPYFGELKSTMASLRSPISSRHTNAAGGFMMRK